MSTAQELCESRANLCMSMPWFPLFLFTHLGEKWINWMHSPCSLGSGLWQPIDQ